MNSTVKTVLFWLLIGISALLLWEVVKGARDGQKDAELNVTQFMGDVDQGNIRELMVNGMEVRGKHKDGSAFHTTAPAKGARARPGGEVPRPLQYVGAVGCVGFGRVAGPFGNRGLAEPVAALSSAV